VERYFLMEPEHFTGETFCQFKQLAEGIEKADYSFHAHFATLY